MECKSPCCGKDPCEKEEETTPMVKYIEEIARIDALTNYHRTTTVIQHLLLTAILVCLIIIAYAFFR
jgi:hypothetical protein